jgi:hypothetical protein
MKREILAGVLVVAVLTVGAYAGTLYVTLDIPAGSLVTVEKVGEQCGELLAGAVGYKYNAEVTVWVDWSKVKAGDTVTFTALSGPVGFWAGGCTTPYVIVTGPREAFVVFASLNVAFWVRWENAEAIARPAFVAGMAVPPAIPSGDDEDGPRQHRENNGHGNNRDGVDCSNPGRGHGGPNGEDDPSGDDDDEGEHGNGGNNGNGKGNKK